MDSFLSIWLPLILLIMFWQSVSQQLAKQRVMQQQLLREMTRIQEHLGMTDAASSHTLLNEQIKQLLADYQTVEAVKLVRETLGYPLLEAKQYVDAFKDTSSENR
ncbi:MULTISPECIES: hypothetical protein [Exiguobacterium]|uniref:Ribosomal protein L7/L12 C-terminal domain-containing protein n=1 Tax=Exiguobacterium sibiricum (strain DSM 17290 / CCUG 55495 / CIP 109462 / JCM 13490 / 255-15) TaxID=262543 RepID=B1YEU1_EXIS2|nr:MULTISPECIES: hypothetical protein [Exiguobacterium]ACB60699.1 conserved hypothetical protein [Exiguobacterium sibiricum 255-15]MCT4791950.1 hypothetical protein [Exiguobacterium artemiae]